VRGASGERRAMRGEPKLKLNQSHARSPFRSLRVGFSVAAFLRNFQTGEAALEAWKLHYVQLTPLLNEIEGFSPFMLVLFNNLQRDSIYGMVFRVTVGALLSTIDATTDIYTFYT